MRYQVLAIADQIAQEAAGLEAELIEAGHIPPPPEPLRPPRMRTPSVAVRDSRGRLLRSVFVFVVVAVGHAMPSGEPVSQARPRAARAPCGHHLVDLGDDLVDRLLEVLLDPVELVAERSSAFSRPSSSLRASRGRSDWTRPSSARFLTTFTRSLRRSSVSGGRPGGSPARRCPG